MKRARVAYAGAVHEATPHGGPSDGLVPQSDVDVAGVHAGKVTSIAPDPRGGAIVTMVIDDGVHLRSDTRALLRPKTAIGEMYIELIRATGSSAPYVSDGYQLPRQQTGQAVELDTILNELDPQTRAAISASLRQLGIAVNGQQADISAAIPDVEQATANLRPLAQVADARQQEIGRILTDLAIILSALADEQDALGRVIVSGDTATGALAAATSSSPGRSSRPTSSSTRCSRCSPTRPRPTGPRWPRRRRRSRPAASSSRRSIRRSTACCRSSCWLRSTTPTTSSP